MVLQKVVIPTFLIDSSTFTHIIYTRYNLCVRHVCFPSYHTCMYTPLKINMESKNHPIEKESHLPNLDCLGSMLIFQGVYSYMSSTQNPGYSLYTRDFFLPGWNLPSYIGIIMSHYKGSLWINQYNGMSVGVLGVSLTMNTCIQEISNRTHVSRTPKKPEYLNISIAPYLGGVRWDSVPFKGLGLGFFRWHKKYRLSSTGGFRQKMGSPVPLIWCSSTPEV